MKMVMTNEELYDRLSTEHRQILDTLRQFAMQVISNQHIITDNQAVLADKIDSLRAAIEGRLDEILREIRSARDDLGRDHTGLRDRLDRIEGIVMELRAVLPGV